MAGWPPLPLPPLPLPPLPPLPLPPLPLLPLLTLLLSVTISTVGDIKMTSLSVSSGSSLQLPTNCTFDPSNHYELHSGNQLVGSYSDDYLAPRLQFTGRLQFDLGSCSFKLINLTEKDSGIYKFVTKYDEKKRIQSQKEDFNITVTGRTAPESPRNNASYNEDNTFGLLAICFLLDPSVAAITMGIYRLFLWFVKKCRNPCPGARPPCWHHTSSFLVVYPCFSYHIECFPIRLAGYLWMHRDFLVRIVQSTTVGKMDY